jgi:ribosomal RNA-processing protein 12
MGKEGRTRAKGGKGNRWRKGQSGLSNPNTSCHRDAARGKFGSHLAQKLQGNGGVKLTQDVLATHDASQEDVAMIDDEYNPTIIDDEGMTFDSSAFSLIDSSHPIFEQVKRLWNSSLESHREICAVLAAVSDVIKSKSKDGTNTETEYFCALLTGLESSDDAKSAAAIAFLLNIVIEKVPIAVLQSQFSSTSKILMTCLAQYETSDSTSLLKSLVSCVIVLLLSQPVSVWNDSSVQSILQRLYNFVIHPKPKLRKCAQMGIASLLKEGGNAKTDSFHPACSMITDNCKNVIDKGGVETAILYVFGLLKECLANLPCQHIKSLCESILKTISLGKFVVKVTAFQCLNGLFVSFVGPQGLTAQLNGRLISALYDHQPVVVDVQLMLAWLTVMEKAHLKLLSLDSVLCFGHLPQFFKICTQCLLGTDSKISLLATDVMKNILKQSMPLAVIALDGKKPDDSCTTKKKKKMKNDKADVEYESILSMFKCIENGLSYKYQSVWNLVFDVLGVFYDVAGSATCCHSFMIKSLKSLNELRNIPKFKFVSELESAFGSAIKSMGPSVVLKAVPLKLDVISDKSDFPQSWLLPVLQANVRNSELSYYVNELLPLAGVMKQFANERQKKGNHLEAKLFNTLEYQIWCLLSSFCAGATDIAVSFPSIAKILGTALMEKIDIRNCICLSLKSLIESCKDNESDRVVVCRYAKNYLPILFNIYTSEMKEGEPSRDPVLDCISSYLSITDHKLLETFFTSLINKLTSESSPQIKIALEDIAELFIPHVNQTSLNELFNFLSPALDSGVNTAQKKSYKLLASILSCNNPDHTLFVSENLSQLQSLLLGSLSTAGLGSKKPRLRCLLYIIPHLTSEHNDFLMATVPEAILCTKESNEKCRNLSYQILYALGRHSGRLFDSSPEDSMKMFFNVILAGLAGTPHMVSATIGALARLVYEFTDLLGSELVKTLLSGVGVFFTAKVREVVRSVLVFIKVAIGVLPPMELAPHVKELVEKVLSWSQNDRNHFRLKARVILERLIRKFDFEMVASLVPKKHQKLMSHIRKTEARHKRIRREKRDQYLSTVGDQDDFIKPPKTSSKPSFDELLYDSEDEERGEKKVKRTSKGGAWIKETDNPVDFLDSSVNQKVLGSYPNKHTKKSSDNLVYSNDGKLIINDDEAMEQDADDDKDRHDLNRKRQREEDESDDEPANSKLDMGSGIHRRGPAKFDFGSEYRAKKAKGDMKTPGKPDPYAYIQLDRQKLNRRKKVKLQGQFKGILNKARKGSSLGRKQKMKRTIKKD